MGFFSRKPKKLAQELTGQQLVEGYEATERALQRAARSGDEKALKKAMQVHQKYEYALLYKSTPKGRKSGK